jgi:hypothetical protein
MAEARWRSGEHRQCAAASQVRVFERDRACRAGVLSQDNARGGRIAAFTDAIAGGGKLAGVKEGVVAFWTPTSSGRFQVELEYLINARFGDELNNSQSRSGSICSANRRLKPDNTVKKKGTTLGPPNEIFFFSFMALVRAVKPCMNPWLSTEQLVHVY